MDAISALIPNVSDTDHTIISKILRELPSGVLSTLADAKCTVRPLKHREKYTEASPALRRLGFEVDAWPAPPAGLFVVEERTVYVRSRSRMTIVHECMHALDCALGGGVYRSGYDAEFRLLFTNARAFVTPYAATGIDEWFAESARAFAGDFNDTSSNWPKATPERLYRICPATHALMQRLFAEIAAHDRGAQLEFVLRS